MGLAYRIWKIGNWAYLHKIPLLPGIFCRLNRIINSCDIPSGTKIGKKVAFKHNALGVVINEYTVIGDGCVIYQNVTFAGKNHKRPTLGKNVMVGAGAVIIGGVKIGDGAKVGANAVVTSDVPVGKTVVGIPARVIEK
jgi:serine O-acetyltransferase